MACASTPTATEYATVTSYSTTTFYSTVSSSPSFQPVTTVVQESCVASGTVGSSVACISSVTQVTTIGTTVYNYDQVAVTSTVPVVVTTPTKTLYATDCSDGGSQSNQDSTTPSPTQVTTSFLVESTPAPSTMVMESSATLSDGSVVETVVTLVTTLPATEVYQTSIVPNPSAASHGSGVNATPIIAGALGGFFGLLLIVGLIRWLIRRRRYSWDDIFDKDDAHGGYEIPPIPVRRQRHHDQLDLSAEPKPYQYGLVGHVVPPAGSGSPPRSPRTSVALSHPSAVVRHSRNTSTSSGAVLQPSLGYASRPSTSGSMQLAQVQGQPTPRLVKTSMTSRVSHHSKNSSAPLIDVESHIHASSSGCQSPPADAARGSVASERSGSPISVIDRRVLQVINDSPSSPPSSGLPGAKTQASTNSSGNVIMHTDGGRVIEGPSSEPPAYSL